MSLFENAVRRKYRFPSRRGLLTVEDLWDLSLSSLNESAQEVHRSLKEAEGAISFIDAKPSEKAECQREMLEILKYIIGVRKKEAEDRVAEEQKKQQRDRILELMAEKQNGELAAKSLDELRAMLEKL